MENWGDNNEKIGRIGLISYFTGLVMRPLLLFGPSTVASATAAA